HGDQRAQSHVLLWRVLALRLPRRRRRQRRVGREGLQRRRRTRSDRAPSARVLGGCRLTIMHSALYTGWVRHRRFEPAENRFRYRIFMSYLDLAELPTLFDRFLFWSARRAAPAWFRRADFHGDPQRPLDEAVRDLVTMRTGARPTGPIRLLTH